METEILQQQLSLIDYGDPSFGTAASPLIQLLPPPPPRSSLQVILRVVTAKKRNTFPCGLPKKTPPKDFNLKTQSTPLWCSEESKTGRSVHKDPRMVSRSRGKAKWLILGTNFRSRSCKTSPLLFVFVFNVAIRYILLLLQCPEVTSTHGAFILK